MTIDWVALFSAFGVGSLAAYFFQEWLTERKRRIEIRSRSPRPPVA